MTAARPYRLELYWDDTGEPLVADAARIASFIEELRTALPAAQRWDIAEGAELYPLDVKRPVEPLLAALGRARETWVYFSQELSAHSLSGPRSFRALQGPRPPSTRQRVKPSRLRRCAPRNPKSLSRPHAFHKAFLLHARRARV